jgi:hypothetical protein
VVATHVSPALIFGWLPVIGILLGLSRARFRRVPLIATAIIGAAYLIYMASVGVYAARCWDCEGLGTTRGDMVYVSAIFFGITVVTTVLGIWLGVRLTVVFGRVMDAARDLRDAVRSREHHADV